MLFRSWRWWRRGLGGAQGGSLLGLFYGERGCNSMCVRTRGKVCVAPWGGEEVAELGAGALESLPELGNSY